MAKKIILFPVIPKSTAFERPDMAKVIEDGHLIDDEYEIQEESEDEGDWCSATIRCHNCGNEWEEVMTPPVLGPFKCSKCDSNKGLPDNGVEPGAEEYTTAIHCGTCSSEVWHISEDSRTEKSYLSCVSCGNRLEELP